MHKRILPLVLATFYALETPAFAASGVTTVTVGLDQVFEAPRWMFDPKAKVKGGPLITLMVQAKKAYLAKDRAKCLAALAKATPLGKGIREWLELNQLQCAQLKDKKNVASLDALRAAVAKADADPRALLEGPAALLLRVAYTQSLLMLGELQLKSDRRSAWRTLDKLAQIRSWLTADERANVYRWAGELSFLEQNLAAAEDFLLRSLGERENAELRARVESIRSTLNADKKSAAAMEKTEPETVKLSDKTIAPSPAAKPKPRDDLGLSDEERDLVARLNRSYDSQDYLSAIEDGVELIEKFPNSKRAAQAADRVLDIYVSLSARTDEKFRHVREQISREMVKVDSGRLARFANNAWARGNYPDAVLFSEKAYTKFDGNPEGTKMLLLSGKAAVASGDYAEAMERFELLSKKAAGSPESVEGVFREGLLLFRQKKYAPAEAMFERLLALSGAKDFEYRALYWQWRAQQQVDASKAEPIARQLVKKYPLSYYGLRAIAELNGNTLEISSKPVTVKVEYRFLDSERLGWERLNILLKAGWFKEAEKELELLPEAQSSDERLVRAKLWASILRYDRAVQNLNKALEDNPELEQTSILKIVYPQEYTDWISRESKSLGLAEEWIRSLMRQESTFRPDAKSTSNAMGLMQLLPATAHELMKDLKIKEDALVPEALLNPDLNIKLGSTYLSRMIKNFGGNIPMALAAYNAGPARLQRWLNARADLSGLAKAQSSAPEVELWIDELPWDETSFYVKAILRNWMIYRLLDGSKWKLPDPIWLDAKEATK